MDLDIKLLLQKKTSNFMKRNIVEPKSTDLKENKNAFKTKRKILDSIAFTLFSYVLIFVGISFILTCSIILFLKGSNLSEDFIRQRAPATLSNIFILSFIFTFVAMVAKYYFFDKPLKNIQAAMKNILKGNYSFRLLIDEKLENQAMMVELFENLNKIASHLETVFRQGKVEYSRVKPENGGYERLYSHNGKYYLLSGVGTNGYIVSAYPIGEKEALTLIGRYGK